MSPYRTLFWPLCSLIVLLVILTACEAVVVHPPISPGGMAPSGTPPAPDSEPLWSAEMDELPEILITTTEQSQQQLTLLIQTKHLTVTDQVTDTLNRLYQTNPGLIYPVKAGTVIAIPTTKFFDNRTKLHTKSFSSNTNSRLVIVKALATLADVMQTFDVKQELLLTANPSLDQLIKDQFQIRAITPEFLAQHPQLSKQVRLPVHSSLVIPAQGIEDKPGSNQLEALLPLTLTTHLTDSINSIVSISGCNFVNCYRRGTGIIVNKSGIILTVHHNIVVGEGQNTYWNSFEIATKDNLTRPRYRAKLLADTIVDEKGEPLRDIALLQITHVISDKKTDVPITPQQLAQLATLPISNTIIENEPHLLLIGYPGKDNEPPRTYCRWHVVKTLAIYDIELQPENFDSTCPYVAENPANGPKLDLHGASGGPALQEHQGRFSIVGIIHGSGENSEQVEGKNGENGDAYIRVESLSDLSQIKWRLQEQAGVSLVNSLWGENGKVKKVSDQDNGQAQLQITLDLYAIDLVGRKIQLLAYAFDPSGKPVTSTPNKIDITSRQQQVVLYDKATSVVRARQYIDKLSITENIPFAAANQLPVLPRQLRFRLIIWDTEQKVLLWEGERWYPIEGLPTLATPPPTAPILPPGPSITPMQPVATLAPPSGRIAYPIRKGDHLDLHIYCIEQGKECQVLDHMSQPDFEGGGYLLAKGRGNGWDTIVRMNPTYQNRKPVSRHSEDVHPRWSPGGDTLIFDSRFEGKNHQDYIYWQEKPNEQPAVDPPALQFNDVKLPGSHPIYLPRYDIAYQGCDTWNTGSHCGIYVTRDKNSIQQKPTQWTDKTDDLPTDTLNGQVLFMSNQEGNWEVYTVGSAFAIQNLTQAPSACDGLATASPDGHYIAFISNRDGGWAIYMIRADGADKNNPTKLHAIGDIGFDCGGPIWREEYMSWGVSVK